MTRQPCEPISRRRVLAAGAAWPLCGAGAAIAAVAADGAAPLAWPAIALIDGSTLAPDFWRARGALVVFWATWCPFCRRHNQRVEQLHRSLAGRGPSVLGVAVDGERDVVARHAAQQGYTFAISLGAEPLRTLLGAGKTLPTTCAVGPDGAVRQRIPGEMTEEDIAGLFKAAALVKSGA